jgi:hypothetical protein
MTSFTPGHAHRYVAHQPLIYSTYDPVLTISGEQIGFIADEPFKHLGRKIYGVLSEQNQQEETATKLRDMLTAVDALPIRGN